MNSLHFDPDWIESPGRTLALVLEKTATTVEELAQRIELPLEQAHALISGERLIDVCTARLLAEHVGSTTNFWLERERRYRALKPSISSADRNEIRAWLRDLPVADMIKFGWIQAGQAQQDRAEACLRFFNVKEVADWQLRYSNLVEQVAFRTSNSFDSHPPAVIAWLRYGELAAKEIACDVWNKTRFQASLSEMRDLTRVADPLEFLPQLREICARSGVALVVARAPNGCAASGSTRFISSKKALLMLSFRHLTDDHFWFSFFHEAGHLILHGESSFFVDGKGLEVTDREREADKFAADALISPEKQGLLDADIDWDHRSIIRIARKLGVSRGIVVGQLQFRSRLRFNQFNFLKTRFRWQ